MSTLNPKIMAVPGDQFACGVYRIINPTRLLQQSGVDITLAPAGRFRTFGSMDTIFTQRITTENSLTALKGLKDKTGIKIIVDFDDLTWEFKGEGLPDYNYCNTKLDCKANREAMLKYAADVIDTATCTNEYLKEAVSEFIDPKKVHVLPNRLSVSEWLFDTAKTIPEQDIFFYAGSATHYDNNRKLPGDFDSGLIRYLQGKKVATMGEPPYFINPVAKFPVCSMSTYSKNFYNYARKCKFILAPLADNVFNKCKSNLKYIESCAVGRVCLVSTFPGCPYEDVAHEYQKIPLGSTYKAVEYIVERAKEHYAEILQHQYDVLNKNYWLDNHIDEYKAVLK